MSRYCAIVQKDLLVPRHPIWDASDGRYPFSDRGIPNASGLWASALAAGPCRPGRCPRRLGRRPRCQPLPEST